MRHLCCQYMFWVDGMVCCECGVALYVISLSRTGKCPLLSHASCEFIVQISGRTCQTWRSHLYNHKNFSFLHWMRATPISSTQIDLFICLIFYFIYLTRSGTQMIQLRCLRLTLWWNGEITKIKIRSLCVGTANQLMLFGIQKGERLRARTVCVNTHLHIQCSNAWIFPLFSAIVALGMYDNFQFDSVCVWKYDDSTRAHFDDDDNNEWSLYVTHNVSNDQMGNDKVGEEKEKRNEFFLFVKSQINSIQYYWQQKMKRKNYLK